MLFIMSHVTAGTETNDIDSAQCEMAFPPLPPRSFVLIANLPPVKHDLPSTCGDEPRLVVCVNYHSASHSSTIANDNVASIVFIQQLDLGSVRRSD